MKKKLTGCHFDRHDDVITALHHFLKVQEAGFYKEGMCLLQDHWTECVNVGEDYVLEINVTGFLKVTPSILSHELINHSIKIS